MTVKLALLLRKLGLSVSYDGDRKIVLVEKDIKKQLLKAAKINTLI
ncbi:hypothetical protein [Clostridium sp. BNL1100]|nr:hypothetical protein [Clostridium sp. BNL1100]AEY64814.1 hypothetical protein Clo1100_0535 [Clostridium sp. BNL1100]